MDGTILSFNWDYIYSIYFVHIVSKIINILKNLSVVWRQAGGHRLAWLWGQHRAGEEVGGSP